MKTKLLLSLLWQPPKISASNHFGCRKQWYSRGAKNHDHYMSLHMRKTRHMDAEGEKLQGSDENFDPFDLKPEKQTILLFPGQGSEYVGMGGSLMELPIVRMMFNRASDLLGYNLYELCTKGPAERLAQPRYQHPALFVTSLAYVERLKDDMPEAIKNCAGTAGMSVGEYASLVFAGALKFEDGLKLVEQRGLAMEKMCREASSQPSGMLKVRIDRISKLQTALEAARHYGKASGIPQPVCQISQFVNDELRVVAGHLECLNFLEKRGNHHFKVQSLGRIPVEAAFHTYLMKDVADRWKEDHLQETPFKPPRIPVYSNYDGKTFPDLPREIRSKLYKAMFSPIKWEHVLRAIYIRPNSAPMPSTFDVGPGQQLLVSMKMNKASRRAFYNAVPVDASVLTKPQALIEMYHCER